MKKVMYFSHDYGARNDPKLKKLFKDLGYEGIGLYWCIIEMMYEQGGYFFCDELESYAFDLRITEDKLKEILENYSLFACDVTQYYSDSVLNRLAAMINKTNQARDSANRRWANEKQTQQVNKVIQQQYQRHDNF